MAATTTEPRTRKPPISPLVIAIEFNHESITAALVDERARVKATERAEMPPRAVRAAVMGIAEMILTLAHNPERGASPIKGIGFCVHGHVDPVSDRVTLPALEGWVRVPLRRMLEEELADSGRDIRRPADEQHTRAEKSESAHPPIVTAPYLPACAAAEAWMGAARGKRHVTYVAVGNTIEAGIFSGGRILQGVSGEAGALGWLSLTEEHKAEYGNQGCLNAEGDSDALHRRALEEWSGGDSMVSTLAMDDPAELTPATIIRAARGGDPLALRVVQQNFRWIGRGVSNLISILNPEAIVIGGELSAALKFFLDEIRQEARQWAAPEAAKQCRILAAALGEEVGLLGAARLAWLQAGKGD